MDREPASKRIAMGVAALVLSVLLCDVALNVVAWVSPWFAYQLAPPWRRGAVEDPVLRWRMSPYYPGHDSRGFRNQIALEECSVVAVGDSQTYGFASPADGAWPQQLANLLGVSVYNAGTPGYSPLEYREVARELMASKPDILLLGLYLGNDFRESYGAVYRQGRFAEHKTRDRARLLAMEQAEEAASYDGIDQGVGATGAREVGEDGRRPWRTYSSLYRLARALRWNLTRTGGNPFRLQEADTFETASEKPGRMGYTPSESNLRTVFLDPVLTGSAVDFADPRVRAGVEVALQTIDETATLAKGVGARPVVVLIHSKPLHYRGLLTSDPSAPAALERRIALEAALSTAVVESLTRSGIEWVDTAPTMRAVLESGTPIYHESDDTHPNATGYGAIARAVANFLVTEANDAPSATGGSPAREAAR